MEAQLAAWVTEQGSRIPVVAFMAGRFMDEMPGMSFGHAGTIVEGREDTASEKIARLQAADGTLELVEANLDECVLCRLCIDAAPPGTVVVRKLYDDGAPL